RSPSSVGPHAAFRARRGSDQGSDDCAAGASAGVLLRAIAAAIHPTRISPPPTAVDAWIGSARNVAPSSATASGSIAPMIELRSAPTRRRLANRHTKAPAVRHAIATTFSHSVPCGTTLLPKTTAKIALATPA